MVKILDGRSLAKKILDDSKAEVGKLHSSGVTPTLGIVSATDDESTKAYQRLLLSKAESIGLQTKVINLGATANEDQIAKALSDLAADAAIHGVLLQTPLPAGVREDVLSELIPPGKDVDGANALSAGRLVNNIESFAPATAVAVMEILHSYNVPLSGAHAVIVGRSKIAGKPVALLLLAKNATVTICHSKTEDLKNLTKQADILVTAIGKANYIDKNYVKPGCVIVDVGINFTASGQMVGDVEADSVSEVAAAISPVPGGVGPVTTAVLLHQTIAAARKIVVL